MELNEYEIGLNPLTDWYFIRMVLTVKTHGVTMPNRTGIKTLIGYLPTAEATGVGEDRKLYIAIPTIHKKIPKIWLFLRVEPNKILSTIAPRKGEILNMQVMSPTLT
jgi:hypothetical protein